LYACGFAHVVCEGGFVELVSGKELEAIVQKANMSALKDRLLQTKDTFLLVAFGFFFCFFFSKKTYFSCAGCIMESEDPLARIEMLEAALQEEEGKLMQAAMFGKTLLTKNQELEGLVLQLREENKLILSRAETEKREMVTFNDRYSSQLQEASRSNEVLTKVTVSIGFLLC
jgi:SpoVK/Ycf46/Vps4 family AAA+-type ATPase